MDQENSRKRKTFLNVNERVAAAIGKIPSHDIQLEKQVLGTLITQRDVLSDNFITLKPEYFYANSHNTIYLAIQDLVNSNSNVDIITVCSRLKEKGELEIVGGAFYVDELTSHVATGLNLETYILKLKKHFLKRELVRVGIIAQNLGLEETEDVYNSINSIELELDKINEVIIGSDLSDTGVTPNEVVQEILDRHEKQLVGLPSGNIHLDGYTGGWEGGQFIVVAARPGVGKTDRGLSFAFTGDCDGKKNVLYFSLEMSQKELYKRLLSRVSQIDNNIIKGNKCSPDQKESLWRAAKHLTTGKKLIINDKIANMNYYRAVANYWHRKKKDEGGLGLIVFDYLQLIEAVNKSNNKEEEVAEISRSMKKLAKDINVPIIALAQLSREVEKRGGSSKRPILSDLRNSGAIEQDADIVIALYAPVMVYKRKEKDPEYRANDFYDDVRYTRVMETLLLKNRHGSTAALVEYYYPEISFVSQYYLKDLGARVLYHQEDKDENW